jgi:hypothetical protein
VSNISFLFFLKICFNVLLQTTQEQKKYWQRSCNRQAGEVSWRIQTTKSIPLRILFQIPWRGFMASSWSKRKLPFKTVGKHYEVFTMDRTSDNHLHQWRAFQLVFLVFMATLDYKGRSLVRLAVGIPMVNWKMYDTSSHKQWMSIASIDRLVKEL